MKVSIQKFQLVYQLYTEKQFTPFSALESQQPEKSENMLIWPTSISELIFFRNYRLDFLHQASRPQSTNF